MRIKRRRYNFFSCFFFHVLAFLYQRFASVIMKRKIGSVNVPQGKMEENESKNSRAEKVVNPHVPVFDGKRTRRSIVRRPIDFNSNIIRYLKDRTLYRNSKSTPDLQCSSDYTRFVTLFFFFSYFSFAIFFFYATISLYFVLQMTTMEWNQDNPSYGFCTKYW